MGIKARFLLSLICTISSVHVFAQDTTSKLNLRISTDYEPKLSAANKVITKPDIKPIESEKPSFTYDLPNFAYAVFPTYHPAKAISIKSELDEPLFGNYFKLGAGNFLTPYAEARIHSVRNKKYNYGFYGKHLSTNASNPKNGPSNANFSDNELGVMGSKIGKKGVLTGKLNFERHVVHYYAIDSAEIDRRFINQIYNDVNGSILYDRGYDQKKFGYKTGFNFYTFSTHGNRRENDFEGTFSSKYVIGGKRFVDVDGAIDYTTIGEDSKNILNRTFVRVKPSYGFTFKKINFNIGANAVFSAVSTDSVKGKFRLFPDVSASHFLVPKKVQAFAEITGDVTKNSLRQLSYINPFMSNDVEIQNSVNSFTIAGGLKGLLAKKLDYLLKVRYSIDNNLPLFVTDSVPTRSFGLVYDDVSTFAFTSGLGFRLDERFFIQFAGTVYSYNAGQDPLDHAWQLPNFDLDVNMRYTLAKKLDLRVQVYTIGQRKQLDPFSSEKTVVELDPIIDLNVMADYRYKKNISFFLNVNNISNSRYQKWYSYPSFGLNLLAGITFSL